MTPNIKTFITTLLFLLCLFLYINSHAASFRMCMAEVNKKTNKMGCLKNGKWMAPEVWVGSLKPSCVPSIIEIVKGKNDIPQIIKVYCKGG